MFGYATDETDECMPLTIVLAHKLNQKLAELRCSGALPWLRPDSKAQVGYVFLSASLSVSSSPSSLQFMVAPLCRDHGQIGSLYLRLLLLCNCTDMVAVHFSIGHMRVRLYRRRTDANSRAFRRGFRSTRGIHGLGDDEATFARLSDKGGHSGRVHR